MLGVAKLSGSGIMPRCTIYESLQQHLDQAFQSRQGLTFWAAPAQIPGSGTTALGSLKILASVADLNPYKPSVILSFHREAV